MLAWCVVLARCLRLASEADPCCAEKRFEPAGYEHLVFGPRAPEASASARSDGCRAATAQRPVDREYGHTLSLAVTNLAHAAKRRVTLRSLVPAGAAALQRMGENAASAAFDASCKAGADRSIGRGLFGLDSSCVLLNPPPHVRKSGRRGSITRQYRLQLRR